MGTKKKAYTAKEIKAEVLSLFPVSFIVAYAFDIVYGFFYYRSFKPTSFFDTGSYYQAATNLLNGKVDLFRTPVYPLFLHTVELLDKKNLTEIVMAVQIIVFYLSIFFFFKTLEQFTSNSVMKCVGTILYGCMSSVIAFNFYVLTESFAISGTTLFCYLIVRFAKEHKPAFLAWCIALTLFLTMLRPSMVFLFVVDGVAVLPLIARMIRKKKAGTCLVPVITLVLSVAALFGYMAKNKMDNNYFGISYVSDMNRFYDVVQADIWRDNSNTLIVSDLYNRIEEGNTEALTAAIDSEIYNRDMANDPYRIADFNKEAISKHKVEYLKFLIKKIFRMGSYNTAYNLTHDSYYFRDEANKDIVWIGDFFDFNVNFSYLICLVTWIMAASVLVERKKLLAGEFMISLMIAGQLAVNILTGPAEFHRLNVICYPLTILLTFACVGLALDRIKSGIPEKTKQN